MKIRSFVFCFVLVVLAISCNPKKSDITKQEITVQAPDYQKMITARVFIKPGRETEFIEAAQVMIENSNKEEGCLEYMLYQDPFEKTNFIFVEKYKNQAAVDFHFSTDYFKEFGKKSAEMTARDSEIKIISIVSEE